MFESFFQTKPMKNAEHVRQDGKRDIEQLLRTRKQSKAIRMKTRLESKLKKKKVESFVPVPTVWSQWKSQPTTGEEK
jgi:hypothetical protein